MKAYGCVELELDAFITNSVDGNTQPASCTKSLTPRERAPIVFGNRRATDPRAGLDVLQSEK